MTKRFKKLDPPKWVPLRDITYNCNNEFLNKLQKYEEAKFLSVWQSPLYQVYVYQVSVPDWPGGEVTWLSIKRWNKDAVRDWRHLQQIKNEICGPEREAMEMFPAESRLVDTSNQYHLWVLAKGHRFPFGYPGRAVIASKPSEDRYVPSRARQRPFEEGLEPSDALTVEMAEEMLRNLGDKK